MMEYDDFFRIRELLKYLFRMEVEQYRISALRHNFSVRTIRICHRYLLSKGVIEKVSAQKYKINREKLSEVINLSEKQLKEEIRDIYITRNSRGGRNASIKYLKRVINEKQQA